MPSLNLAISLRVIRSSLHMILDERREFGKLSSPVSKDCKVIEI
jgi:hypothetical protein